MHHHLGVLGAIPSSTQEKGEGGSRNEERMVGRRQWALAVGVGLLAAMALRKKQNGDGYGWGFWDKDAALGAFRDLSERLGVWAIPLYVVAHALTLSLCLPYAVFFEAGASLLFGFFPAVFCVFFAKLLGASLSFYVGRLVSYSPNRNWESCHVVNALQI